MTCDDVRERLLTCSMQELADLAPHLERCPDCAALADRIRDNERELRTFVEGFVNRPTAPEPGRSRPWLYGGVVALAVAATLWLALSPDLGGVSHGAPPPAWDEAQQALEAFYELPMDGVDVAGLDRAAEDQLLAGLLRDRAGAMKEAQTALELALESDEAYWRVQARMALGDLHAEMAEGLLALQEPSYLTDAQRGIYRAQLAAKADAQLDLALDALERARGLAEAEGLDEALSEVEARLEDLAVPSAEERARRMAEAMLPGTRRILDRMLDGLDACDDPPPEAEQIRADLVRIRAEMDAGELERNDAWQATLGEHQRSLHEHCGE